LGLGFNVQSLLGLELLPPYLHYGAAESLAAVVADVRLRTDNGRLPDLLSNPAEQARVVAFVQSIDAATEPISATELADRPTYSSPITISHDDKLIWVVNPSDDSVSVIRPDNNTRLAKIPVGDEPQSVALTPDNRHAYVANAAANSVTVIRIGDATWGNFAVEV
jgi:YVTN family beta-propeller protein